MKLMKYKDNMDGVLADVRVREMHKKCELEICQLESYIMEIKEGIQEYSSHYPIDFDHLLSNFELLKERINRKEQLKRIMQEMFSDE